MKANIFQRYDLSFCSKNKSEKKDALKKRACDIDGGTKST